jgi:hypothetical protein
MQLSPLVDAMILYLGESTSYDYPDAASAYGDLNLK